MDLVGTLAVECCVEGCCYLAGLHINNRSCGCGSCGCCGCRLGCSCCCFEGIDLLRNIAFECEFKAILDLGCICNCSSCCCGVTAEVVVQTCDRQCEACVVVQSRLGILVSLSVVLIVAVCSCRTADQCTIQCVCAVVTVRVCCTVMDLYRGLIAVAKQEAVAGRVIAQQIVHLVLCVIQIFVIILTLGIGDRILLPCTVVAGCAPSGNRVVCLILVVYEVVHLKLDLVCIDGITGQLIHHACIAAPDLVPAVYPVVILTVISAVARLKGGQRMICTVCNMEPDLSPCLVIGVSAGAVHVALTILCVAGVFCTELVQSLCILQTACCILCIHICKCMCSGSECGCHFKCNDGVVAGCGCPVGFSLAGLHFRCEPFIMVAAVRYIIYKCDDITVCIQIGGFHEVIAGVLKDVEQVCFRAGCLEHLGVIVVSPAEGGCIEAHCQAELDMVAGIMIAAGYVHCIGACDCLDLGLFRAAQTNCTVQ